MPTSLSKVGSPDRVELLPGLVVEDKLKIKTQRRLEKAFNLPIRKIFKGKWKNPVTGAEESRPGVDFEYLDNMIPLLTILGRQVQEDLLESFVEDAFDNLTDLEGFKVKLRQYFQMLGGKSDELPKDLKEENPTKEAPERLTGA